MQPTSRGGSERPAERVAERKREDVEDDEGGGLNGPLDNHAVNQQENQNAAEVLREDDCGLTELGVNVSRQVPVAHQCVEESLIHVAVRVRLLLPKDLLPLREMGGTASPARAAAVTPRRRSCCPSAAAVRIAATATSPRAAATSARRLRRCMQSGEVNGHPIRRRGAAGLLLPETCIRQAVA